MKWRRHKQQQHKRYGVICHQCNTLVAYGDLGTHKCAEQKQ